MTRRKEATPAGAFEAALREALEHYTDPLWLGRRSPLATPYFLGRHLQAEANSANTLERGETLKTIVEASAAKLWRGPLPATRQALIEAAEEERRTVGNKGGRYYYYLLELRYLRNYFPSQTQPRAVEAIPDFVSVSSTRFFIHLEQAIAALGKLLLDHTRPALRLEQPLLTNELIGRTPILEAVLADLAGERSVAVTGVGGVGKTSLGAALAAAWPTDCVFWFTFRPGLNDDLDSLLFATGHFLQQSGRSSLWLQLLASEGKISNVNHALGLLREDLHLLHHQQHRQLLLCFDEVDLLQTSSQEPRRKQHIQVLEWLESLRGLSSLLLIGQRVLLDTDAHYALQPLPPVDSSTLLQRAGVHLDDPSLRRLHRFTQGNPRLLELYAALHRSGDEATAVLELPRESAARPLFHRLWRRLDEGERFLLGALSAFRSYAPRDAWLARQAALAGLIKRNLIKSDLAGGIALLPFFRELVYEMFTPDQRRQLHRESALIRAQRGDYTAAAYHYGQAEEYTAAVQVWFPHQDQEILRGRAEAARQVFEQMPTAALAGQPQRELKLIQNRLFLLAGEAERVLEGMEGFSWDPDEEMTADAHRQWGLASENLGQTEAALEKYEEAITTLARLTTKITGLHFRRGQVFIREKDTKAAHREAQLALYDVEWLLGHVEYDVGHFGQAHDHWEISLRIAEEGTDHNKLALAHYGLTLVAGRQGRIKDARYHAESAMAYYAETGNRLQLEGIRAELAGMYLNVREFAAVIEPAEKALRFFEQIKHERWITAICNNLAEAYLETGQIDKAKEFALRVLHMELPVAQPNALYTLGHVHERQGNFDHAETSFRQGIQIAQQHENRFLEAYLQRALGNLYLHTERDKESAAPLELALQLFTEMGLQTEIMETQKSIQQLG